MKSTRSRVEMRRKNCIVGIIVAGSVIVLALGIVISYHSWDSKNSSMGLDDSTSSGNNAHDNPTLMIRKSRAPTPDPVPTPTTFSPISTPSVSPPTKTPTNAPASSTTQEETKPITYRPGIFNNVSQHGLFLLSEGLASRIVAETGVPVSYSNGEASEIAFHQFPDGGAIFEDLRPNNNNNIGGWIYMSNSRVEKPLGEGGVGSITFSEDGEVLDYRRILTGSTSNSGGGRTPWNSFISCEERFENGTGAGSIYQIDPLEERQTEMTNIGKELGTFGGFAYDERRSTIRFFATEARRRGAVRRFTPSNPNNWTDNSWGMLHGPGILEYLYMNPTTEGADFGYFMWIDDLKTARVNAGDLYPGCDEIDIVGNKMYLISKQWHTFHILNLDDKSYRSFSTENGIFAAVRPEEMEDFFSNNDDETTMLYFTEELGEKSGVHALDRSTGQVVPILKGPDFYTDESVGLAFSPNGLHMLVAFQHSGILLDVTRTDGHPFFGRTLNLKYHQPLSSNS